MIITSDRDRNIADEATSNSVRYSPDDWGEQIKEIMEQDGKIKHAAAMENLVETRKKQHETIQHLQMLLSDIQGGSFPEAALEEWSGLVELTEQIADANDAIARLVDDCRVLIGI